METKDVNIKPEPLSVEILEEAFSTTNRLLVMERCGGGKTWRAVEFMARNYKYGITYVAERNEQLEKVFALLTQHYGISEDLIQIYNQHTDSKKEIRKSLNNVPIILITHTRMTIDHPTAFCHYSYPTLRRRGYLIIDEFSSMASVISIQEYMVKGILSEEGIKFGVVLEESTALLALSKIRNTIVKIANTMNTNKSIRYSAVESISHNIMSLEAWQYVLELTFYQIFIGNYRSHDKVLDVMIPLALQQAWGHMFDKVMVLDATAGLTPYLYPDFHMIGNDFDFSLIKRCTYYNVTDFDFSKTKLRENLHTFLDNDLPNLKERIESYGAKPYIVTYKEFADEIRDRLSMPVVHYGLTKGSNEYRECDCAVLIGAYRLPPDYLNLARIIYPGIDENSIPVANWIQEIYRTRIREGKNINVIYLGDRKSSNHLRSVLGIPVEPAGISMSPRNHIEARLRKESKKGRKLILKELGEEGICDLEIVAKKHMGRDMKKARSAYKGLVNDDPYFSRATELDGDIIKVRDKL